MSHRKPANGRFLLLFIFFGLLTGLPACATNPVSTSGYVIQSQVVLPDILAETSGLFCQGSALLTINDSGNAAEVYELSITGEITDTFRKEEKNKDWEAITVDDKGIYVGDFGNNHGKRKDLQILVFESGGITRKLNIKYAGNQPEANVAYAHDADAEALTIKDGQLILFSKSWKTGNALVYLVDRQLPEQTLSPVATIADLPGMITGADWDKVNNEFVIVGYSTSGVGLMTPFIATLDQKYDIRRVEKLVGFSQVEGVCTKGDAIWFTQEQGSFSPALLVNIRFRAL